MLFSIWIPNKIGCNQDSWSTTGRNFNYFHKVNIALLLYSPFLITFFISRTLTAIRPVRCLAKYTLILGITYLSAQQLSIHWIADVLTVTQDQEPFDSVISCCVIVMSLTDKSDRCHARRVIHSVVALTPKEHNTSRFQGFQWIRILEKHLKLNILLPIR